jgi:hypothetical protein
MTFERKVARELSDKIWIIIHRDLYTLVGHGMVDRIANITLSRIDTKVRLDIIYPMVSRIAKKQWRDIS